MTGEQFWCEKCNTLYPDQCKCQKGNASAPMVGYLPQSKEEFMAAADRVIEALETMSDEQLVKELCQLKDGAIAKALRGE